MSWATKTYIAKHALIAVAACIVTVYLANITGMSYPIVSTVFAIFNGLLVIYYYSFFYNNDKEMMLMQSPINLNTILFAPIIFIFLQSIVIDVIYIDQISANTAFIVFNKYLVPSITFMWISSARSLLKIIGSVVVGFIFSFSMLTGLDYYMNNLSFINIASTHPFAIILLAIVIIVALYLGYKTYMLYRKDHNDMIIDTFYYMEMLVVILACFQKLFIIEQPFNTFFATFNLFSYQIAWFNYILAIASICLMLWIVYRRFSKKQLLLYILPIFIISFIYIGIDKLVDRSKIGCEMIAQLNKGNQDASKTIYYNNVPIVGFSENEYEKFSDENTNQIQKCISSIGNYENGLTYEINKDYMNHNKLDSVSMNGIFYLINDNLTLNSLFNLGNNATSVSLFQRFNDKNQNQYFAIIPNKLAKQKNKIIQELKMVTDKNSKIYIISSDKAIKDVETLFSYNYQLNNQQQMNVNVSILDLTKSLNASDKLSNVVNQIYISDADFAKIIQNSEQGV